ncbi:MAG: DNA repair protein RecN [Gemmatimonadetes bacterium]|nr:DNA repair protein RecN [Gemmatimonadota bacterium]
MLVELRIRDYAVVDDLVLELGPGLNVLTGETGAGKSIIVGALGLLLGERASSTVVRTGAERATVEAVFDVSGLPEVRRLLEEQGFRSEEGLLILRREVAAAGRNRAWVNGSPATAGALGELGNVLVDLHGQHEHQTLLRSRDQRAIIDAFGGATEMAARVAASYADVEAQRLALEEREERVREIETRADFLRFQLDEIDGSRVEPGEDVALEAEARRHEHAADLVQGAEAVHDALYAADDSVADRIARVRRTLERLAQFDPGFAADIARLDEARVAVEEAGRRAGDYASEMEHDPLRLERVRERLDKLFRLKRKYGPELGDVLATAQRVRAELAAVEDADHDLGLLKRHMEQSRAELEGVAAALTGLRVAAAERLGAAVAAVLPDLGLPGASFEVGLVSPGAISAGGAEGVEFLVSPNRGFEAMPLSRIASGGELSRIMLALKSVLAEVDAVPVLVFDEIDAGVGGVVAGAVADKLSDVATRHQVFVVTHLAQVASRARHHLLVEKGADHDVTAAAVRLLTGESRVEEIARMLGGDPESATSREHARELLGASSGPKPSGRAARRTRSVS